MTLGEMATTKLTPMMAAAVAVAIRNHGPNAAVTVASGTVTKRKGSNAYLAAKLTLETQNFEVYPGPRAGRYASSGYKMIVVDTDGANV